MTSTCGWWGKVVEGIDLAHGGTSDTACAHARTGIQTQTEKDRKTLRHRHRLADTETNSQRDSETHNSADTKTQTLTQSLPQDGQKDKEANEETDKETDKETARETDREGQRRTERWTEGRRDRNEYIHLALAACPSRQRRLRNPSRSPDHGPILAGESDNMSSSLCAGESDDSRRLVSLLSSPARTTNMD